MKGQDIAAVSVVGFAVLLMFIFGIAKALFILICFAVVGWFVLVMMKG